MTTSQHCRSLYVHVPFCRRKCGYCDFFSQVPAPAEIPPLVDALLAELAGHASTQPLELDTIFVGGGTPTVLPDTELERLLAGLRQHIAGPATEFTVEANPATVSDSTATILASAGVNRVSLGAQSFDDAELLTLDRAHQPRQVGQTVAICRQAGIERINLDLIFGIPGQTAGSWQRSLRAALALEPEHISCYGLTYEVGTPLHKRVAAGQIEPLDPDLEAELYEAALDLLPAAGYAHYEISNFARPGGECRHNLLCWHNYPYLGIGPAAAGFVDGVRYKNVSDTRAYVRVVGRGISPRSEHERLTPAQRARETAMLELRLATGIDRPSFERRYGQDPVELFAAAIEKHDAAGLLVVDAAAIRLTRAGTLLANTVMMDFL